MQNTWWLMNFQGTVVILRSKFNMSSIWRFSLFFPATPPLPLQAVSLAPCPLFIFVGVLAWQFFYMYLFRASVRSMSYPPVDFWPLHVSAASRAGLVSDEIRLGIIWEISAWFSRRDKAKDPGYEFWHQIYWDTKQTRWNTKILNFTPIIASATLKAVSLQLNGMLMIWKIKQEMQDDAIRTARIHPTFILLTGLKCSYHGKISSPLTEILGTHPAQTLIWTHLNFYKGLRGKVRFQKPDSCGSYLWKA